MIKARTIEFLLPGVNAEGANFLSRSWESGRWIDGARFLAEPARTRLYRLGMRLRVAARPRIQTDRLAAPAIIPAVAGAITLAFAHPPMRAQAVASVDAASRDRLFRDADRQISGWRPLAGGVYRRPSSSLPDPEDRHSFHRLYWALRLARAAAFGHDGAARYLAAALPGWLDGQDGFEPLANAPYTASERIASLVEALFWMASLPGHTLATLTGPVQQQIARDAAHLSGNVEYALGVHNHLLNNARGLYLAARALPGAPRASCWESQAFGIWDEYFPRLVLEDGAFAEQSSHYHVLLCRTALEYVLAARRSKRNLPGGFAARIERMFRLANDLLRSDGSMPRFGDNSPDGSIEDLWGLLAAAFAHRVLDETPRHRVITPLTLYYCDRVLEFRDQPEIFPERRIYPSGGFAFLRPAGDAAELVVHADPGGETRGHGDAGCGSFEVWRKGEILIREPGCFLSPSIAQRTRFRSAAAQNVTSLDGLAPAIALSDRLRLPAWYGSVAGGSWQALPGRAVRFDCHAFARLRQDVGLARVWRWEKDGTFAFEESLTGLGPVRFASRIHLGDGPWAPLEWDGSAGCGAIERHGANETARIELEARPGVSAEVERTSFVPEYGIEKPASAILLRGALALPFRWALRCRFRANKSASGEPANS